MIIIFDYDGTIADTLGALIQYASKNFSNIIKTQSINEDVSNIRNRTIKENLAFYNISPLKFAYLYFFNKSKIEKYMESASVFEEIPEVLKSLHASGHKLFVLTSHSGNKVKEFIKKNNINYFDNVYSTYQLFGKPKLISKLLADQNISKDGCIYVGDEVRDIQACRKSGIKIISVTWGFNSKEFLVKHNPDFVAETPKAILEIVANLNAN